MQKSTVLIGLLVTGLAIALVTTVGSLATFAENQSRNNIEQNRADVPMMQSNAATDMMHDMDMMSMDNMTQGDMMGSGMNMGMMNSTMSMQDMMGQMMGSNYVHMGMNKFMSSDMKTSVGTRITWQNHDHVVHNVVGVFNTDSGDNISVRSQDLGHMDSWSYTFNELGTFEYVCAYHESEGMRGRIVVSS